MTESAWVGKTLLGRYQIVELLGQGGMAEVYRGDDPNLGRAVAIKLIHRHLASEPGFLERFEREARAIARLRHPNLVQVFDFNHEGDVYFMVMEYIDGPTLQTRLRELTVRGERLPLPEVVGIMSKLVDAIHYAHTSGMIHRDLKPSNIMFTGRGEPVIADFGLARIVGGVSHTVTGAVIGTPLYMSPEQGRGDPSDERSDIYSLGVILYEMATGVVPFTGDTPISVMMKHVTEPLRSPLAVNPDIPPLLAQVIETALAKNPADRFATAEAMSAALTLVKARLPATKPPGRASPSPSDPATVIESPVPAATTPAPRRVESGRRPEAAQAASVSSARAQPAERVSAPPPVIAEPRVATPMRPVPSPARAPGMPQAEAKPPAGRSWMTIGAVAIVGVCLLAAIVAGVFAIPRLTGSANTPVPTTGLATSAPGVLATAPQIATIAPTGTPGQVAHATGTALPAVTDTPPAVEGMIEIPAGEFIRGSDSAGAESRPQRRIALKAFLIDKTEVTNAQFAEFVKATGHKTYFESLGRTKNIWSVPRPNTAADSLPEYPVVFITWDDAHAFCKWAGKRLPTEAEWEKAARGADGNIFPWGNDFDPARSNSALNPNSPNGTMPVGSFPDGASPFGVLDMSGNVWEYVSDWYSGTYFAISPDADPPGPASGSGQVLRGGGWFNDKQIHLSAIFRDRGTPDFGDEATGFRCAKDAP